MTATPPEPTLDPLEPTLDPVRAYVATLRQSLQTERDNHAVDLRELDATQGRLRDALARLEAVEVRLPGWLPGYGLPAFEDTFDGPGLDPKKWTIRTRENLGLTEDAGIPDASMVTVSNGLAHIGQQWLATPEARPLSKWGISALTHKVGYIDTAGLDRNGPALYEQMWGRWSIRFRTAGSVNTYGLLLALWLRNRRRAEIDMMEEYGGATVEPDGTPMPDDWTRWLKGTAVTTLFTNTSDVGSKIVDPQQWRRMGSPVNPAADFHDLDFDYLPNRCTVAVDGKTIITHTPTTTPKLWGPEFMSPFHLRANIHVGNYWGIPNPAKRSLTGAGELTLQSVRAYPATPEMLAA
jgi:hypothetical protein